LIERVLVRGQTAIESELSGRLIGLIGLSFGTIYRSPFSR
jgi:hypothetical protein